MSSSRVELHLYDVSQGFVKHLAPAVLGMEVEGLWHCGIVVNGVEYHYGPSGLWRSFPQQTFLGTPTRVTVLGQTSLAGDDLEDAVRGLVRNRYNEEQYDVLFNNGNHFVNDLSLILTGSPLPDYVLNQIQDILATPIGERLVYMLPPFLFSRNHRPSRATPAADPAAASTSRGPFASAPDTAMDDPADACPKTGDPQAEYRQYQAEYQDLDVFQLVQDVLQNLLMGWHGAASGYGSAVDPQDGSGPHGFRPHHGPYHHPHGHPHHHPHGPPPHPPHGPPHNPPHGPPHGPPPHHSHGPPPHRPPPTFGPDHGPHGFGPHPPHFGPGGFSPGGFGPGDFGPSSFGSGGFGPGGFGPGGFGLFGFGPRGFGFGPFGPAGLLRGLGPMGGGCMKRRGPCGMGFGYGGGRGRGCGGRRGRGCGPWGGRGCAGMEGDFYGYDCEREEAQAAPAAAEAGGAAGPSISAPKPQAPSAPSTSAPQSQEPHPSAPQQHAAAPAVKQAPLEAPVPAAEAEAAASVAADLARISVAGGAVEGQAVPRGAGGQEGGEAEAGASQWDVLNVEEVAGARKIE